MLKRKVIDFRKPDGKPRQHKMDNYTGKIITAEKLSSSWNSNLSERASRLFNLVLCIICIISFIISWRKYGNFHTWSSLHSTVSSQNRQRTEHTGLPQNILELCAFTWLMKHITDNSNLNSMWVCNASNSDITIIKAQDSIPSWSFTRIYMV